ncbi:unnamed protein product [Fraxinus pennsylvanica]|uniref:Uncharacterized protein n=1 Tax=Fraxinus pennsylvanica TaxID=56036 RepID=A0AAD2E088_9LAMI|nr:unnamed protein product [Fraxinus pennsylvanica]
MDPNIMKFLEEDEDETMPSGADVEAFTAALNRDIEGDTSTSRLPSSDNAEKRVRHHRPSSPEPPATTSMNCGLIESLELLALPTFFSFRELDQKLLIEPGFHFP